MHGQQGLWGVCLRARGLKQGRKGHQMFPWERGVEGVAVAAAPITGAVLGFSLVWCGRLAPWSPQAFEEACMSLCPEGLA